MHYYYLKTLCIPTLFPSLFTGSPMQMEGCYPPGKIDRDVPMKL